MKKYLFGIACLIMGVLILMSAQTTPAHLPAAPTVPNPPNPYCNRTLDSFHGSVICPLDGIYQVDVNCADRCLGQYQQCMLEAFNDACTKYNAANTNYESAMKLCLQNYDTCFAQASTIVQREACRTQALRDFNECLQVLQEDRDLIETDFVFACHECQRALEACSLQCCEKVGDFPPKPGDH